MQSGVNTRVTDLRLLTIRNVVDLIQDSGCRGHT